MTEIAEIQAYGPGKRSVGPEEFSLSSWCGGPSSSPRESEPDGIPQKASQFPSPPPIGNESAATGGLDCEPQSEEGHSSFGESMDEYDNDPVPVEELLREKDLHDSHAQGFVLDQEHTMWTKRDLVIASSGLYKPWFFSRFAKGWIGISRQNALSDIRSIMGSGRDRNKEIAAREREQRERESECQRGARSKRILTQDESCGEGSEEESETWVGCDECGKWRKVPDGVEIDAEKNFFCRMLPGCMCSTPEEDWSVPEKKKGGRKTSNSAKSVSLEEEDCLPTPSSQSSSRSESLKRKAPSSPAVKQEKKSRKSTPPESAEEFISPEDGSASLLHNVSGAPAMSRLSAVVRVLSMASKPLHYDLLTRQALKLSLIKFTGSQGTAGESMKAFLNKTIRENKSAAIVNLGKGIYGLKEWSNSDGSHSASGSASTQTSETDSPCAETKTASESLSEDSVQEHQVESEAHQGIGMPDKDITTDEAAEESVPRQDPAVLDADSSEKNSAAPEKETGFTKTCNGMTRQGRSSPENDEDMADNDTESPHKNEGLPENDRGTTKEEEIQAENAGKPGREGSQDVSSGTEEVQDDTRPDTDVEQA